MGSVAIAYVYDGCLYLAVTRRCTLHCTFCPKTHGRWKVAGNSLRDDPEPTTAELITAAEAVGLERQHEVAFVGLGEPTLRLPVVLETARALRARGFYVRLVTDGLASLREGHDVAPLFEGAFHEVDVSLNAPDGATYTALCPNPYGERAHAAACDFLRRVRLYVACTKATVVAIPGLDLEACRALARELRVELRVRPYFDPLRGEPHATGLSPNVDAPLVEHHAS